MLFLFFLIACFVFVFVWDAFALYRFIWGQSSKDQVLLKRLSFLEYIFLIKIITSGTGTHTESQMTQTKIILTGYGPFRDITENPSEVIAKQVSAKIQNPSSKLHSIFSSVVDRTIAVSHKGLDAFYEEGVLNDPEVTHIVHVGVAAGVQKLHLETIAFNVKAESAVLVRSTEDQEFTDDKQNDDQVTVVVPIDASKDALQLLPSTFDLNHPRFHRFVQRNASCVTWSRDAGTYFCNEIYYRTLLNVTKEDEGDAFKKVIFVHVPLPEVLSEEQCAELIVQFLEVDAGL
ncbi:hypothetical protein BJ741DRAFT_21367 [Chytriomyces cf. hyalinus JEL632]|nr:hypothetical protein BJ741DRAFT_21367 [Chytriomyces cf. hyalinus JEL632]